MEFVERAVLNLNSPPDRWFAAQQGNLQLEQCAGGCFRPCRFDLKKFTEEIAESSKTVHNNNLPESALTVCG
jgi:hypothetical protein